MISRNNDVPEIIISGTVAKLSIELIVIVGQVNDLLCDMCKDNNFHLISNKDIIRSFIHI